MPIEGHAEAPWERLPYGAERAGGRAHLAIVHGRRLHPNSFSGSCQGERQAAILMPKSGREEERRDPQETRTAESSGNWSQTLAPCKGVNWHPWGRKTVVLKLGLHLNPASVHTLNWSSGSPRWPTFLFPPYWKLEVSKNVERLVGPRGPGCKILI